MLRDEVIVQKSEIYFQQCRNSLSAVMQFTFSIFLTISIAQPLPWAASGPLVDRVGASLGLYSSYRGGRGGHPSVVAQYNKYHLSCIISLAPDWPGNDTTQMILGILAHHQRVSSSLVRADEI